MIINQWIWGLPSISRQTMTNTNLDLFSDDTGFCWRHMEGKNPAKFRCRWFNYGMPRHSSQGTFLGPANLLNTGEFTCDMMGISPIYTQQYNATTVKPRAPMTWPFLPIRALGSPCQRVRCEALRFPCVNSRRYPAEFPRCISPTGIWWLLGMYDFRAFWSFKMNPNSIQSSPIASWHWTNQPKLAKKQA